MGANRFVKLLVWLNHHDWPPATMSPVKAAVAASLVSFQFIFWVDGALVMRIGISWAELLALSWVPLLLASIILYRSPWRRTLATPIRAVFAAIYSIGIFAGVLFALCVALLLGVMVYSSTLGRFAAFHY